MPQPMPGFRHEPPDFAKNAYRPGLAASVYQLMKLFKWPQHADPQAKTGVSYLELSIAWMTWSGSWLPIIKYKDKQAWASRPTTESQVSVSRSHGHKNPGHPKNTEANPAALHPPTLAGTDAMSGDGAGQVRGPISIPRTTTQTTISMSKGGHQSLPEL